MKNLRDLKKHIWPPFEMVKSSKSKREWRITLAYLGNWLHLTRNHKNNRKTNSKDKKVGYVYTHYDNTGLDGRSFFFQEEL